MKKIVVVILALLIAGAAIMAIYRFNFRKSIPTEAPIEEQVAAILTQNECLACHDHQAAKPFYINFPIIGERLQGHIYRGTRFTDLKTLIADLQHIDEASLAKLEHTMLSGSMPLLEYKLAHWGTGFNAAEKSVLAGWIRDVRAQRFATGLAAEQFANEPVQPLREFIPTDSAKVALGFSLFTDGRLSTDGTISCATCHPLEKGGVDGTRTSEGIAGQFGGINAPTVYNAVFNCQQFWNGRAADLAEQAAGPPVNPIEMGTQTWEEIAARLNTDKALVQRFKALYPEGLTPATVTDAIAEFEKTLITPNAPFDKYLKGDTEAITADQIAGYELFKTNKCATCHAGQTLGGQSFEYMGIAEDYFAARTPEIVTNNDDQGLFGFSGNENDLHKFKTPNLRNIALTAPYLHDGSAKTLNEAVIAMFRFENGTAYTQQDVEQIVDFLGTLTGENPHLQ
ncbi:MAG: cytochrome c peroxidase [Alistipes sp.]